MTPAPVCLSIPPRAFLTVPLTAAVGLLTDARARAVDLGLDPWEFAIDVPALLAAGMSQTDLRWLVCRGYAELRQERTRAADPRRVFRRCANLSLQRRTCSVLTAAGLEWLLRQSAGPDAAGLGKPEWDRGERRLICRGLVVKEFRVPAANQEVILDALQEEGWPRRIDDPLPGKADQDPKARLHDAIKTLNRHQRHRLLRFRGDGTGLGVLWEELHP